MTNVLRSGLHGVTSLTLAFMLFACGGGNDSTPPGGGTDTETIVNPGQPPTAYAGAAASCNGGEIAMLDGTGSTDPDGDPLRYTWTQTGGANTVQLSDTHAAQPVFGAPDADDVLTFSLKVNDGYDTSVASFVTVTTTAYTGTKVAALSRTPFRGHYTFANAGQDIVIAGSHVFLAAGTSGMRIVDSSDPVNLTEAGTMTIEDAHDVTFMGNFVYHTGYNFTSKTSYVYATDVTNPASPGYPAQVAMFNSPNFARLTSVGNVLYVAGGDSATVPSLIVSEVTDTTDPYSTEVKISLPLPATPLDVEVAGNYAYVTAGASGLRIIDVSSATEATPVIAEAGSYDTAGTAVQVAVDGNYAYVADGMNGVVILDVGNPASPGLVATIPVSSGLTYGALSVDVANGTLYYGDDSDVLIYDVATPSSPVLLGQYRVGSIIRKVRVSGSYLYVSALGFQVGLQTIPITKVSLPRGAALYTATDAVREMKVYGDLGFVRMERRIDILDMRDAAAPSLLASYPTPTEYLSGMTIVDNFVYLAEGVTDKLALLRFRDPTAPGIAKTIDSGPGIQSIVATDTYAYLYRNTFPSADIVVYDVTKPYSPVARGTLASPYNDANWLRSMAVKDDRLYLTESSISGTFRVADVSNPDAPALIGNGFPDVDLYGIAFCNDYVFTVGNNTGVKVLEVSTPSPVYAGTGYPWSGYTISVAANRAYVNSDFVGGGIKVIDAEDPLTLTLAGELALAGGADLPVVKGETLYSFYNDMELHRNEREPMLAARYVSGSAGADLSYSVSWMDEAGGNDHAVKCRVTGGSCSVGTVSQAANTVTVTWTLPGTAGEHEIMIAVGNGHYFGTTKDRVRVQ